MVSPGDTVWVHDYHLMLLPTMLKSVAPSPSLLTASGDVWHRVMTWRA